MEHAHLPNTCQYTAKTDRGDYIVQVAWPLIWGEDRVPHKEEPVNTIYVVDGNAYFFTAVDVTRRTEFTHQERTVVVGIGYPNKTCVYDHRRGPDLTPPTADGKYDIPLDAFGQPQDHLQFGEASIFLDTIENTIMPHVQDTLFPKAPLNTGRKALFGHSYGGIFALNTLYTKPELFNTIIAGSPVVWWNYSSIIKEQEKAFLARKDTIDKPPALLMTYGSAASELKMTPGEPDESFAKRKACSEADQMETRVKEMVERLGSSPNIRNIWTWKFEGEDHGSSAVTGVQHGIIKFLCEKHIG
ncbi:Alpha/Beta hydrolase protein [Ilyonectria robusta]|uniref:Alpha/Beta hydrolase protein n=1 Tax=Ilyonectria robusta TaxID=1079257 RepID=UPI001E8D1E4D|nr:Alpha/Beta hydrolase protein [Ilyonectria robusta]KAH8680332.1 Alpha/Beta hydrolase protein [Ilyonectria robusta]